MDQESSSLDCEDSVEMEFICFLGSYYNTIIGVIHCASSGLPRLFACCGYFFKKIFLFIHLLFINRLKSPSFLNLIFSELARKMTNKIVVLEK